MMMSRKLWAIFLVICMVVTFAACGVKSSDDDGDSSSKKTSKGEKDLLSELVEDDNGDTDSSPNDQDDRGIGEDEKNNDRDDIDNTDTGNNDGNNSDYNPLEGLESVKLPSGYPEKEFPFFQGTVVTYAIREISEGASEYIAICIIPATLDELRTFYGKMLEDADKQDVDEGSNYMFLTGDYSGYRFDISIASDSENNNYCSGTIILKEIPSADSVLASLQKAGLPEGYPSDLFPIMDQSAIFDSSMFEYDGRIDYYEVSVYTTHTLNEVVTYYEDILGDIEDKSKYVGSDEFELSGYMSDHYFYIRGLLAEDMDIELTHYFIRVDPLEE